jgi:hypothetical protein
MIILNISYIEKLFTILYLINIVKNEYKFGLKHDGKISL